MYTKGNKHPSHSFMRKPTQREYVLSMLLALIVTTPLATDMTGSATQHLTGAVTNLRRQVLENRADLRAQRRAYDKVRAVCLRRSQKDETVECPEFNDKKGIRVFLRTTPKDKKALDPTEGKEEAAAEEEQAEEEETQMKERALRLEDLNDWQKSLLRRYQRTDFCSKTMNDIVPGFYELCLSVMRKSNPRYQGILNERAQIQRLRMAAPDEE